MLRRCNFQCGIEENGQFKGRRLIDILPNSKNTKTSRLGLLNKTFDCDPEDHRIHEDPDDPYDYIKIWHHYNENLLPHPDSGIELGHNDRFFRREAPIGVLKDRMKKGITFRAGLHQNQLVGKNAFSSFMNEIARECNFINPDRQTAASLRSEHICTLVNAKDTIDSKVLMASTRHKSLDAHNVYKRKSKEQLDKKTIAFHAEKSKKIVVSFYSIYLFISISLSHYISIQHRDMTIQTMSLKSTIKMIQLFLLHHHKILLLESIL